ncbi:MAG: site-specific DNA-methyltransferase [Methanocalculaceae archaeon]|jgi:DNA modification methylase|nr:site-specific DNA-methyltransferase [Methanocalculaceae archaeon]
MYDLPDSGKLSGTLDAPDREVCIAWQRVPLPCNFIRFSSKQYLYGAGWIGRHPESSCKALGFAANAVFSNPVILLRHLVISSIRDHRMIEISQVVYKLVPVKKTRNNAVMPWQAAFCSFSPIAHAPVPNRPISSISEFNKYLSNFIYRTEEIVPKEGRRTQIDTVIIDNQKVKKYTNEFWTAKQRNACSLHEISYRACFKPQLPRFFIDRLTAEGDVVYDPFGGRGTTIIEAVLSGRKGISNDINPLSEIFAYPRLHLPNYSGVEQRLKEIPFDKEAQSDIDLSMFYHKDTFGELVSLKEYLQTRKSNRQEDDLDKWIRMVATNRLTGHSPGFLSVYTLPPNQAVSPESQMKINQKRNQIPEYRDIKKLILKKTWQLLKKISAFEQKYIKKYGNQCIFINADARLTDCIPDNTVQLSITSPPFLNVVQYSADNWLRCWFNGFGTDEISKCITMSKTIEQWTEVMGDVFKELYRITKPGGWIAFEVGEVRKGSILLDEVIVPLGIQAGFSLFGILINDQEFTKTANIWGISNNTRGTNTNRIVIFVKKYPNFRMSSV